MVNATARGTVFLYTILPGGKEKLCHLNDVRFVPKLSCNLLSVTKTTGVALNFSFDDNEYRIARADCVVIAVGKKVGSLFHLMHRRELELSNAATVSCNSKEILWHQRYGRWGVQNLKKLATESLVTGFDFDPQKNLDFCESCVQDKLHRCSSSANRANEPLGLVHSDLCGKITTKSAGGAEYFMTLTDVKTRYVWVYALKKKGETFKKFQIGKLL